MKQQVIAPKHIFIATLSTEPQGVTRVLDWLLAEGYPIGEAVVVHTTSAVIQPSLATVTAEFEAGVYPDITFQAVPIAGPDGPTADILSAADVSALLKTLYRVLRQARQSRRPIHFSITSGRKTMAVYGMVVAQLLFTEQDRLWHMIATDESGEIDKRLHAEGDETMDMVKVPVLRWADATAAVAVLNLDDPWEAIQKQQAFTHSEAVRRRQEFLNYRLSKKERELLILLARTGLDNAGLASKLGKREQTIANQLTEIYRKFEDWSQLAKENTVGSRTAIIAEFAPYLAIIDDNYHR